MQKILSLLVLTIFFSCNNEADNGKFTIKGKVKNFSATKIYLEELHFNQQAPTLVDSAALTNHTFSMNATSMEEGLYRLRFSGHDNGFLFINDKADINFTADSADLSLDGPAFNTPANNSLKKFIGTMDSLRKKLMAKSSILQQLQNAGTQQTDSSFITALDDFNLMKENITAFCFKYGDTTQSPVLAIFATTAAPVEIDKFEIPLDKLAKRFPKHNGIAAVAAFAKQQIAQSKQQMQGGNTAAKVAIGGMAPEITMPDTEGNSFSLSALKGKYVLVDFWASWCGPCRAENPNVVAAYNKFKDKNFTVLGVSLDKSKAPWLKAIEEDKLAWKHISDLQYWNSVAVGLYGFDGIPYNVLVDPQGKVIATELRGEELMRKLGEVLK